MHKKYSIGIILIAIYIVFLFTIPPLVFEKSVTPILAGITVIMVAIYVLLGLDIIHRTVIAMFGAILSIILAILLGSMVAEDSLHFVIESVDFNTIGLLLGMMIMVAILGETGVFHQVGIKLGKIKWIVMEYEKIRILKIYEYDKTVFVLINSDTQLEHTVDNILGYYYDLDEIPKSLF